MAKIDLKCFLPYLSEARRLERVWHMLETAALHRHVRLLTFWSLLHPFLFNQLSTAIHWTLHRKYHVHYLLHYLDDFFTAGSPNSEECSNNLTTMLSLVNILMPW